MNVNVRIDPASNLKYVTLENQNCNINKYCVKKTWKNEPLVWKDYSLNLLENNFDLLHNDLNLIATPIYLDEELKDIKHYYTIFFKDEFNNEYYFHVDYKKFHNISYDYDSSEIYFHNFHNYKLELKEDRTNYKFLIMNDFDNYFQVKVINIDNDFVHFQIPEKNTLTGSSFKFCVLKSNDVVYSENFALILDKKGTVHYNLETIDNGSVLKCKFKPIMNYSQVRKIIIKNELGKIISDSNFSNHDFKQVVFYVPHPGIKQELKLNIDVSCSEDTLIAHSPLINNFSFNIADYQIKTADFSNIKSCYNFINDSYLVGWDSVFLDNTRYNVYVSGKFIGYTKNSSFLIKNFKQFNDYSSNIECEVRLEHENSLNGQNLFLFKTDLINYHYLYKGINYVPYIDYSKCVNTLNNVGELKWEPALCPASYEYSITSKNDDNFLDEYAKPWDAGRILNNDSQKFDDVYKNYEEKIMYNFGNDKTKVYERTPNDSKITYEETGQIINNRLKTMFKFPVWYNQKNGEANVTVIAKDYWGNELGKDTVKFGTSMDNDMEFMIEDLIIKRGQPTYSFGESGTIGEYYKIVRPTPLDTKMHYDARYRTYLGTRLTDKTNIDRNGKSLGLYFSGSLTNNTFSENIEFNFRRASNFYRFEYMLENTENKEVIGWTDVPVLGDKFEDNSFKIARKIFNKIGEYTMKIKTYNSIGGVTPIKEIKFQISSNRPDTPVVNIRQEDYDLDKEGKTIINKKYFQMKVLNNGDSDDYAGWKIKESHFFFKLEDSSFKDYPDYVIQADTLDGSLVLNNSEAIENGKYICKVISYDYAGNKSNAHEFRFTMHAKFEITPEILFVNHIETPFKWTIKKPQDVNGFYWFYRYTLDGINWYNSEKVKVDSKYYVNDSTTSRTCTIETLFKLPDQSGSFEYGKYQLVCFEFNNKHSAGVEDYNTASTVVEVSDTSDPSTPIYCINNVDEQVYIGNRNKYNEWVYTKDMNILIFQKTHNDNIFDDPTTPDITEGMHYKIVMIEPHLKDQIVVPYEGILPKPTSQGTYTFSNILTHCNINNPIEGVWELRLVTIDKFGNSNMLRGYYTYYINYIKRDPAIDTLVPMSSNSSSYFGLDSYNIGYYVNTSDVYSDILNYVEHKDKFAITSFEVKHLSNPNNSIYTTKTSLVNDSYIDVMAPLTESDKNTHSKDGLYQVNVKCIDYLKRQSTELFKSYTIDTIVDSYLSFLGNNTFYTLTPKLTAAISGGVTNVKYTQDLNLPKDQWMIAVPEPISDQTGSYTGVNFSNLVYDSYGYKTVHYIVEEESGNKSETQKYTIRLEPVSSLTAMFDYNNKIFYTLNDSSMKFTWYSTNPDVTDFKVKIQQCSIDQDGNVIEIKTLIPSLENGNIFIEAGPGVNGFIDVKNSKEFIIDLNINSIFLAGIYKFTVQGFSLYETAQENFFIVQYDKEPILVDPIVIVNPTITVSNNIIEWTHVSEAAHYEVSYNGKDWIKTFQNRFHINTELLKKEKLSGETFIYVRWKNKSGFYSTETKTLVNFNNVSMKDVTIKPFDNKYVTIGSELKWNISIENSEIAKYLFYSFDKVKWLNKPITGSVIVVSNNLQTPISPGTYDIYAYTTDGLSSDNIETKSYNKTNVVHSSIEVKQDSVKGNFIDVENNKLYLTSKRLYIENKEEDVDYFIYVNGKLVSEGHELNSSTVSVFYIGLYARRKNIDKTYTIYDKGTFSIRLKNEDKYTITVGKCELKCVVSQTQLIMYHTLSSSKQVIMFREKGTTDDYNILYDGQPLDIKKEWEFMSTDFMF